MWDIVRESALGQFIRLFWSSGSLAYPEERVDFILPSSYEYTREETEKPPASQTDTPDHGTPSESDQGKDGSDLEATLSVLHPFTSREQTLSRTRTYANADGGPGEIIPTRTHEGLILVDWYTDEDQANPQNWSTGKKVLVTAQICAYTFSVYIGSSLYVASEPAIMEKFHVGDTAAALGLALYVLAYGIGPMLW